MKTNKKNMSGLIALLVLGILNFALAKDTINKENSQDTEKDTTKVKTLATLDCTDQKQAQVITGEQDKKDYLFIGCNGFY